MKDEARIVASMPISTQASGESTVKKIGLNVDSVKRGLFDGSGWSWVVNVYDVGCRMSYVECRL